MDLTFGGSAPQQGAAAPNAPQQLVIDATAQNFMAEVIDASMSVAVLAIFWSPSSPQSQKTVQILERMVVQAGGKVRLARINMDQNRQLAQQMQVQTLPTIVAIKEGRPLDMLPGPQTEHVLKSLLDSLTGNAQQQAQIDAMLAAAKKALTDGEAVQAAHMYQQILQVDQGNAAAIAGFLRCHIALGNIDQAKQIIASLPDDIREKPEVVAVVTSLDLLAEGVDGDLSAVLQRLEDDPNDHQARYDLAMMAFSGGDAALAVRELLDIVSRDRSWNDDGARKQLIKIFEALGPSDPVANAGRRKLQMMLMV